MPFSSEVISMWKCITDIAVFNSLKTNVTIDILKNSEFERSSERWRRRMGNWNQSSSKIQSVYCAHSHDHFMLSTFFETNIARTQIACNRSLLKSRKQKDHRMHYFKLFFKSLFRFNSILCYYSRGALNIAFRKRLVRRLLPCPRHSWPRFLLVHFQKCRFLSKWTLQCPSEILLGVQNYLGINLLFSWSMDHLAWWNLSNLLCLLLHNIFQHFHIHYHHAYWISILWYVIWGKRLS